MVVFAWLLACLLHDLHVLIDGTRTTGDDEAVWTASYVATKNVFPNYCLTFLYHALPPMICLSSLIPVYGTEDGLLYASHLRRLVPVVIEV